jgi:hypothetical protein
MATIEKRLSEIADGTSFRLSYDGDLFVKESSWYNAHEDLLITPPDGYSIGKQASTHIGQMFYALTPVWVWDGVKEEREPAPQPLEGEEDLSNE